MITFLVVGFLLAGADEAPQEALAEHIHLSLAIMPDGSGKIAIKMGQRLPPGEQLESTELHDKEVAEALDDFGVFDNEMTIVGCLSPKFIIHDGIAYYEASFYFEDFAAFSKRQSWFFGLRSLKTRKDGTVELKVDQLSTWMLDEDGVREATYTVPGDIVEIEGLEKRGNNVAGVRVELKKDSSVWNVAKKWTTTRRIVYRPNISEEAVRRFNEELTQARTYMEKLRKLR